MFILKYPETCGPYKIDKIRDLTAGLIVDFKKNGERSVPVSLVLFQFNLIFSLIFLKLKQSFPSSKSSQMITFYFANGCILTLRTSGTEPKIKWYSEIRQTDMSK